MEMIKISRKTSYFKRMETKPLVNKIYKINNSITCSKQLNKNRHNQKPKRNVSFRFYRW